MFAFEMIHLQSLKMEAFKSLSSCLQQILKDLGIIFLLKTDKKSKRGIVPYHTLM